MKKDIFDRIEREDLTEELLLISDVCGIETVQILLRHYSGLSFYIPKISRFDGFVIRYINENLSKSCKEIANELSVSEQYIRIKKRSRKHRV